MPKLSVLQLAQRINRQVQYDLPIGPGNTTANCIRTGSWSSHMVRASRLGVTPYTAKIDNGRKSWVSSYTRYPTRLGTEKHALDALTRTIMHKAGNCGEMSSLAMLRLAQYAAQNLKADDVFCFRAQLLDGIDHQVAIIELNGEQAVCDPWANCAKSMDSDGLIDYINALHKMGLRNDVKETLHTHRKFIREDTKHSLFVTVGNEPFREIHTLQEARRMSKMHEENHKNALESDHKHLYYKMWRHTAPEKKRLLQHKALAAAINEPHKKNCRGSHA